MEDFGDELPVLTLMRIIEQVRISHNNGELPQVLVAVKKQFANEFPGTPFPWNEPFVLEMWQQCNDENA
jgi:hypothetical protein